MIHSNLIILDILVKFKTWRNVSQNAATSNIAIWLWCRTADRTAMVWHVSARTFAKCCLLTRPELVSTSHMFLDNRSGKIHEERSAHLAVYFKDFTVTNKRFKRRFFLVFRQLWEKIYEGYWPLKYPELKALECGKLHKKRKTVVIFASWRNIILVIEQIIASMYVISWIHLETAYHKWQHESFRKRKSRIWQLLKLQMKIITISFHEGPANKSERIKSPPYTQSLQRNKPNRTCVTIN